ncbi:unnamed protein product [Closterium sp. NIES-65]|nr:unnamed protein product [Closterium sp. NIES-65]
MVKLFSRKIDQLAEGAGVGGGADHEGGGEKTGRVATGETKAVEEQEGGAAAQEGGVGGQQQVVGEAAAQEGGAGGQQQEGVAAAQEGGAGVQQQEFRVAAAQVGGSGEQEQEDGEAAEEYRRGDERQAAVTRSHRTASGSGQVGPSTGWPSTAGQSTANVAPGGQVVELLQRVEKSSKSTLSKCAEAVKGVTAERNLLEGARAKIDEMSGKIIEGVVAAITKASEDAVEKQLKQVEERLVAAVLKGFEKAIMEDMFCSTLPPETMKELKDIVREGYHEAEAGRLEVLTEAMARGFQRSAGPSTRSRQEGVGGVRSGAEPRGHERSVPPSSSVGGHVGSPVGSPPARGRHPVAKPVPKVIVLDQSALPKISVAAPIDQPDVFASMRDMLQDLGKTGGKGVVAGEKSGTPNEHVASTGNRALGMRGASTPSGGGAGKGAGEASVGLLSKTKAASATHGGGAGLAVGLVGNLASSSTPPVAPVAAAPSLGNVCLSDPGSPSKSSKRAAHATESIDVVELASVPGQAPVEKTSIVVAARQEKAKKARVTGHTPPPRPDDQGKTRGCKRPFKGPGFGLRKGKLVSEQTVGGRKRFLGTFETEKDQKFCTAVCWRVYFPDVVLTEYEGYTAQDEEDWKVYLDAAAEMPTGVWSVAQEQGECRFDEKLSREDIKKDALAAANAAIYAPETPKKACVAAMSALVSILLHVGKTFPAKQWPDHLYSSAVEGLGSTDAILLQMLRVAAQVCTQWCCCRAAARLLEDAGYGSLAMPEEKSKAKQGVEDAAETETSGQGE